MANQRVPQAAPPPDSAFPSFPEVPDHDANDDTEDFVKHDPPADLPREYLILSDRLRAGKVVLCTGAALGAPAGRPTWREIVEQLLDRIAQDEPGSVDVVEARALLDTHPLTASGYVKRTLGAAFRQALADTLPHNQDHTLPELVEAIGKLPFRAALTTAYDDLLEQAFAPHGAAVKVYSPFDSDELRGHSGRGRYVLHLLGAPHLPHDIVFSAGDVQEVLANDGFRQVLHDLYQRRTFLFIGFDDNDPDFEILVSRLMAGVRVSGPIPVGGAADGPRHFAVLPGLPRLARDEFEAAFGIRVLADDDPLDVVRFLHYAVGDQAGEVLPDDDDLDGWLRVLTQEPGRPDALLKLDGLATHLREVGDTDRLIELYLGRVEVESEAPRRAECLRRVSELLEQDKGQMAEAFASMVEAYREDPQPAVLDELERLAGTTGQWNELLGALRDILGGAAGPGGGLAPAARADAWLRIARLYGDKLNHLDYALTSLGEAQKITQNDRATTRQMRELRVELTRRAERWKELADALGALAADTPERERQIDLYLEQGEVYESRLSDGVSAAAAFNKALAADPECRDALTALEHLLRRHRKWGELVALLDRKAALLRREGEMAAFEQARREAAAIATEHLARSDSDNGGNKDPGSLKALQAGVAGVTVIDRWEAIRSDNPGDLDALRALEKLYAKEGSYSQHYLDVLSALADSVPSDKERLTLYRRLAAEYDELPGHGEKAAAALERILDLDPSAEDAYRGLQRIYRHEKKWVLLIDTLRRHNNSLPSHKAEHYAAIARIYETDLPAGDARQALLAAPLAIDAWNETLQLDPEHKPAMESLSRLYLQTEAWDDAVLMLDKRANLSEDKAEIVALRYQAARLTADHLLDSQKAEERLVRALAVDPTHVPSMTALVELYRQQGEYLRAARLLTEAAVAGSDNRLDKARYLVEAAELYATIDDQQKAAELYLQALAVDPEHVEAGVRAADLLWEQQRHAELVPVLEMLTRKEGERQKGESTQGERLTRLGLCALAVGDEAKALKAFTRAAELDVHNQAAQQGRAKLLFALGRFQEALDAYSAVLDHHQGDLGAEERVELFYFLGECERRLSRPQRAKLYFGQGLAIDPGHRPTLKAELLLGEVDPYEQIEVKRALLASAQPDEKLQLLVEIGDLYAEALKEPPAALSAYREALELRPDAHAILHKCLDLLGAIKDWTGAMEVLERLITLEKYATDEKNIRRRARYKQAAALIARDELEDFPTAMALFDAALEDDPTLSRAAADLEKLAQDQGDHRELARIYRRKIKQLGPDSEHASPESRAERLRLWSALAQLCLTHLGDAATAIAALEVTVSLDRGNLDRHRLLAGVYMQAGPDQADKAILAHQTLLRMNKGELSSYRALKKLYLQVKQREKAAHVACALHILKKAEPEDESLVAELHARPLTPAKRPIKNELWKTLTHPEEDLQLGALFQAVLQSVQLGYARPYKDSGIALNSRVELSAPQLCIKALRYGVEVLDAMLPEVYLQAQADDKERPYTILHCAEKGQPATICVQLGAALTNPKRPEREVMYEMGRLAATLRNKRVLRTLLPSAAQLGMIIDAAMVMGGETAGMSPKAVETAQGLRRSLLPAVAEQVAAYGKALREQGRKGEPAAQEWLGWADMTAVRAGLLLAGDLETVALLLATDPSGLAGSSPLTPKQRLLELIHFSVSEEYFTIRQYLGLMG